MNTDKILEKVLTYLDNEHKDYRDFIARQSYAPSIPSKADEIALIKNSAKGALDRGMGVVMFAQDLGVKYDDINKPYEEFKTAVQNLKQIGLNDAKRL